MQCDKCRNEPVIFQPYSGRHLCREHVVADIESRIKRDIRAGRWMRPGDHLAVTLSGSRRSRALLYFFHKLTARRRDIQLSAIVIDEGIAGYRDMPAVIAMAETLGIACHCGSFEHEFHLTIDEYRGSSGSGLPCAHCRQLRHELIETIARREAITRIISDRTLEDQATEILGNILLGLVENLLCGSSRKNPVPWIDPLGSVPRAEADLYADLLCPGADLPVCPHHEANFFDEIKDLLEVYSVSHPATPYSISGIGKAIQSGCEPAAGQKTGVRSHAS